MKVVINNDYGGFGLSAKAKKRYLELNGQQAYFYKQVTRFATYVEKYERIDNVEDANGIFVICTTKDHGKLLSDFPDDVFHSSALSRYDPILVQVVEELGKSASGCYANLKVVDIENGRYFKIDEYDGYESIQYRDIDDEWMLAQ